MQQQHDVEIAQPAPGGPPQLQMLQLGYGAWVAQAVSVFARLRVADVLSGEPMHVDEIAQAVGAHGPSLYRLLRAVGDYGVVTELEGHRFASTPLGETLRHDLPGSCAGTLTLLGSRFHRATWSDLYETVRTGEPAFTRVHGVPFFEYLQEHPDDAAVFNAMMTEVSEAFLATAVPSYDFSRFGRIVDVGGGEGYLLGTILAGNPDVRGVLFDLPQVIAAARPVLTEMGVEERCELVAGDFFDAVPPGGDAYVLSNVIHDWDDERSVAILRRCRAAMGPGSTLLLIEAVLSDRLQPDPLLKLVDVEMLVSTENGRQRTRGQLAELLELAGLRLSGVTPSPGIASIVEAVPAEDSAGRY